MVSLGDDGRRSGGFFFDNTNADTDDLLDSTSLGQVGDAYFKKIPSVPLIIFLFILMLGQEVCVFLLPSLCNHNSFQPSVSNSYSIVIYIHVGLWMLLLIADRLLRRLHRTLRSYGYLEFYRKTRNIRRMPIMVHSGVCVLLLLLTVLLWDVSKENEQILGLSPDVYLQILISIETLIMLPVLGIYLARTLKFNKTAHPPDVSQEDAISGYINPSISHTSEVGFRDDNFVDDLLEKQADMIRYLRQHNIQLGKKIVHLTSQLGRNQRT